MFFIHVKDWNVEITPTLPKKRMWSLYISFNFLKLHQFGKYIIPREKFTLHSRSQSIISFNEISLTFRCSCLFSAAACCFLLFPLVGSFTSPFSRSSAILSRLFPENQKIKSFIIRFQWGRKSEKGSIAIVFCFISFKGCLNT